MGLGFAGLRVAFLADLKKKKKKVCTYEMARGRRFWRLSGGGKCW